MKLISINIPEDQIDIIEHLVKIGKYPNRSEAIRNFINVGIKLDLDVISIVQKKE